MKNWTGLRPVGRSGLPPRRSGGPKGCQNRRRVCSSSVVFTQVPPDCHQNCSSIIAALNASLLFVDNSTQWCDECLTRCVGAEQFAIPQRQPLTYILVTV